MRSWRTRFNHAAKLCMIGMASLSACACLTSTPDPSPTPDDQASSRLDALKINVMRDPRNIEAWAELIQIRVEARQMREANDHVEAMLGENPNDYRALLVAANFERVRGDLKRTEDYLFKAHTEAPKEPATCQALASFFRSVSMTSAEAKYWKQFAEAVPVDSEMASGGWLAHANALWRLGEIEKLREVADKHVDPEAPGAVSLRVRLALLDKDFAKALRELMPPPANSEQAEGEESARLRKVTPEVCALLLRMLPFAPDLESVDLCEGLANLGLAQLENPQARMSCLFVLWECGLVRQHIEHPGNTEPLPMPPGMREIGARIDQIDHTQRDWVVRRWMVASVASGIDAEAEQKAARDRMAEMRWPSPSLPNSLGEVILAWQIEDGLRLRLYEQAADAAQSLHELRTEDVALHLVLAQIALEARRFEQVLSHLEDASLLADERYDERRLQLRWHALLGSDNPRPVLEELVAMNKGEMQPEPMARRYPRLSAETLSIATLAVYYAEVLGVEYKDLFEDAEEGED